MQNEIPPSSSAEEFGMTPEDIKNYKVKSFFGRIGYYFSLIGPAIIKILNTLIYYLIRFIKAFVSAVFRMILGKEV